MRGAEEAAGAGGAGQGEGEAWGTWVALEHAEISPKKQSFWETQDVLWGWPQCWKLLNQLKNKAGFVLKAYSVLLGLFPWF